jgi:hypothetical protein
MIVHQIIWKQKNMWKEALNLKNPILFIARAPTHQ